MSVPKEILSPSDMCEMAIIGLGGGGEFVKVLLGGWFTPGSQYGAICCIHFCEVRIVMIEVEEDDSSSDEEDSSS